MKQVYLENVLGIHHKFYKMYTYAYVNELTGEDGNVYVTCRWGRIGTEGQEQHHKVANRFQANELVEKKLQEKLGKGYEYAIEGVRKRVYV